jgi:hypothetical protein
MRYAELGHPRLTASPGGVGIGVDLSYGVHAAARACGERVRFGWCQVH